MNEKPPSEQGSIPPGCKEGCTEHGTPVECTGPRGETCRRLPALKDLSAFLLLSLCLFVRQSVCPRQHEEMSEMVWFAIVACPLYFVREHTIHVRNNFYRHIHKALAKDAGIVRSVLCKDGSHAVFERMYFVIAFIDELSWNTAFQNTD
jgi:hypothetical protein